ncbi:MAG: hypothetical protein WAX04_05030 [Oscillospiraceae bacterium]
MKLKSKRGIALSYVIVITAVLLILASALFSVAKFNLDYTQNSLEGRQAYLDAKSAIEYGKAYLAKNPGSGDFAIISDSTPLGLKIGLVGDPNVIAVYDSAKKIINAYPKYKTSDRVERLGYKTQKAPTAFLAVGRFYGSNEIFHLLGDFMGGKSECPIVTSQIVSFQSVQTMEAPEINFLTLSNKDGRLCCLYSTNYANVTTLLSDFISFNGNIIGAAYAGPYRQELFVKTQSGNDVIVRFTKRVKIELIGNSMPPVVFEPGYYSFPSDTDFFELSSIKSKATKLNVSQIKDAKSKFQTARLVTNDLKNFISSEDSDLNWTTHGSMGNNIPSAIPTSRLTPSSTVFLCASGFISGEATYEYKTPNLVFQWEGSSEMLFSGTTTNVTFDAQKISINMKSTSGIQQITQTHNTSKFLLTYSSLTHESPIIVFASDTQITTFIPANSKTIIAGTYRIADTNEISGVLSPYELDLFDPGMKLEKIGGVSGGSGGVYTDGK